MRLALDGGSVANQWSWGRTEESKKDGASSSVSSGTQAENAWRFLLAACGLSPRSRQDDISMWRTVWLVAV
ncbi:hypothetical protein RESH_00729 [Rhodopirellula europaea SH398]|uniref:Uncharacterized protein n=1 Tax=Rhodopirellula europaea SH398 TaxID=1263868 RepID=M5SQX5_9BACT|nr:hypothetical protein RESH_00729 [Rhodopirellula europaea SH398]